MGAYPRVYSTSEFEPAAPALIRVTLGDLLPLVALAHRKNYLWLRDFLDDEVAITADLYDVVTAFRCTRPSA